MARFRIFLSQCRRRRVRVQLLPQGMAKRNQNTSYYSIKCVSSPTGRLKPPPPSGQGMLKRQAGRLTANFREQGRHDALARRVAVPVRCRFQALLRQVPTSPYCKLLCAQTCLTHTHIAAPGCQKRRLCTQLCPVRCPTPSVSFPPRCTIRPGRVSVPELNRPFFAPQVADQRRSWPSTRSCPLRGFVSSCA